MTAAIAEETAPQSVKDLTPKQLETIRTAHRLGFYKTPRDATLDELAAIFGISKAAVHNRLQAAERLVIGDWLEAREHAERVEKEERERRARERAASAPEV